MPTPKSPTPPLLPLRAAVVLLFSAVLGAGAGTLTYIEKGPVSPALVAVSAFAGAAAWLHKMIAP